MKFALRLTTLGVIFTVMFSVIGLRLWFIQVAEGSPDRPSRRRGDLGGQDRLRRKGRHLRPERDSPPPPAGWSPPYGRPSIFVQPDQREPLIQELASIVGVHPAQLEARYEEAGINGRFQVSTVSNETAYAINESLDELPRGGGGQGPGTGLPIRADDGPCDRSPRPAGRGRSGRARGLEPRCPHRQAGVERVYDEVLQGTGGSVEYRVRRGEIIEQRPPVDPVTGSSLVLNLDLALQESVELALESGVALSNEVKEEERADGEEVFNEISGPRQSCSMSTTFDVLALASSLISILNSSWPESTSPRSRASTRPRRSTTSLSAASIHRPRRSRRSPTRPNSKRISRFHRCGGSRRRPDPL